MAPLFNIIALHAAMLGPPADTCPGEATRVAGHADKRAPPRSASRRVPPAVAAWARACACALPLLVAAVASLRALDARTALALVVCLAVGGCLALGGVVPVPSLAPEQTAAEVPPILRPGIRSASGRVGLVLGAQTDADPVLGAQSAAAWAWLYDSGEWPRLPRVESRRALHDEVLAGLRVERQSVPPPTGWRQRLLGLLARFLLSDGPGRLVLSLVARRMRAATLAGPERYYLPDEPWSVMTSSPNAPAGLGRPRAKQSERAWDEAAVFGVRWLALYILDMLVDTLMKVDGFYDHEERNGCAMCGATHEPATWDDVWDGRRERWAWLRAAEGACGEWLCSHCVQRAFPEPQEPGAIRCPACARAPCTLFVVTEWGKTS